MPKRPLSSIQQQRIKAVYKALTEYDCNTHEDIATIANMDMVTCNNTLSVIKRRPEEAGFEVLYAAAGPAADGDVARYKAIRLDGTEKMFTKDELEQYLKNRASKIKTAQTILRVVRRQILASSSLKPASIRSAEKFTANRINDLVNTLHDLIELQAA